MLNGLDLFSGIGGLSIALNEWVRPIAYCEIDPYCQGVLMSRFTDGTLPQAPIWDNISTLRGATLPPGERYTVDIIYGGFPCQDISVAGHGKGLEGERSRLFYEIMRLAKEIKPKFIFLENVPAICARGGLRITQQITSLGYDCRWCVISAASIGAHHKRERWFLLAHAQHNGSSAPEINRGSTEGFSDSSKGKDESEQSTGIHHTRDVADSYNKRGRDEFSDIPEAHEIIRKSEERRENNSPQSFNGSDNSSPILNYWENIEPPVCGMAHGIPNRMDRIRALGNAVVPQQAKKAFKMLIGLK